MKEIKNFYSHMTGGTLKVIIDDLYNQVTDEIDFSEETGEELEEKTIWKKECLIEALKIYIKYFHHNTEYDDQLSYISSLK